MKKHDLHQPTCPAREQEMTVIVGRCTLARGDYVQVAEQAYIILGMD